VIAETPYLVMLKGTFRLLEQLRARGVRVALLTNSMAATDALWVHSRYAFQRRRLLNMGVELYEYRPDAEYQPELIARYALMKEKTPLALHAKTMVIDRESVFVGSFNMDPRSTHLNTEIGLIIENPALAREVARLIEKDMAPTNSWRLEMTPDSTMEWATVREGRQVHQAAEPDVGLGKVLKFLIFAILPIYRML
jgi:putative cardiolipin synthase